MSRYKSIQDIPNDEFYELLVLAFADSTALRHPCSVEGCEITIIRGTRCEKHMREFKTRVERERRARLKRQQEPGS